MTTRLLPLFASAREVDQPRPGESLVARSSSCSIEPCVRHAFSLERRERACWFLTRVGRSSETASPVDVSPRRLRRRASCIQTNSSTTSNIERLEPSPGCASTWRQVPEKQSTLRCVHTAPRGPSTALVHTLATHYYYCIPPCLNLGNLMD